MTRKIIEGAKESVIPYIVGELKHYNVKDNGEADAEEARKDFEEIFDLANKALEQEPTTKNDLGFDCISRKQAIAAFPDLLPNMGYNKKAITEILQDLPPVTPQPCEDAVSRQEVLDLIADYDLSMGQVVRGIHALPSVTSQEPFINKLCVSSGVCENDKQKVLDKIRAEIEELPTDYPIFVENYTAYGMKNAVLKIIDKYKAESGET